MSRSGQVGDQPPSDGAGATAVRVAAAMGLFVGAAVAVPILMILGAWGLVWVDLDSGWTAVVILFTALGLPSLALLVSKRWRPAGIGAMCGLAFCAVAVFFYAVVLNASDF